MGAFDAALELIISRDTITSRHDTGAAEGPNLAQGAVVVQASQAGDVFRRDGGCVLLQDQRVCVCWIGHHQHLQGFQVGMRVAF